ncbi:MAG: ATP-binding protein [Desulfobacterales bacterium]|uniref:ATP-binding protein n=1 Tax=Candidatus Desulfatibia vada TaxID=2841696 RepID=A0A8J6P7X0_9BACT|nr:ATP-binding protein [Candidatus Desulfatibia vada]
MRYITPHVLEDLKKKMVFVGGPRQVGKTTLAKAVISDNYPDGRYFNWDYDEDRQDILQKKWSLDNNLLVFDELHKFPRWKTWIKGIYDVSHNMHSFLVTGSARLDIYRRGGDSLMGRYHYWRLHPFTLDEIPNGISPKDAFDRLMTVGGFPEPFLEKDERTARRWRRERFDRVLREDIRDLESIRNIQLLGMFLDALRHRVGGKVVLSNMAGDLQISPKTAKSWLEVLERMYLVFTVLPFTKSLSRAVLKQPKVFFFDNADVLGDEGARFENLVATSLLKRLNYLEDRDGYRYELRYIRDKEGREVDFAIIKEGDLEELIEVKYSDESISKSLLYYTSRLNPKRATQLVATLKRPFDKGGIKVTDPISYFNSNFYPAGV